MLSPVQAYEKAEKEGPSDDTRNAVLSSPEYSFWYARYIDKSPRDDTRNAVLSDAMDSYRYAAYIDKIIFTDSHCIYFVDIHNIGMRWIRRYKYDVGFMPVGCFCLDVL